MLFELFSGVQVTTGVGFNGYQQCCMKVRDAAQPVTPVWPFAAQPLSCLWQHSSLCGLARGLWELTRLQTTFPTGLHYSEAKLVASLLNVEQQRTVVEGIRWVRIKYC